MKALQRIICVDDEPDMRLMVQLCLENLGGYQVKLCSSGPELLDGIEGLNPDLIILDAVMPGMDGLQTFERLKNSAAYNRVPVLFMTGKRKEYDAEFMSAGAIGVVTKPFDPVHLAADIEAIWRRYQNG